MDLYPLHSGGYFILFLHKFQLSIFRSDNIPDASRGRSVDHFVGQKSSSIKIDWGRCSLHLTQASRKKRKKATAEADDSGYFFIHSHYLASENSLNHNIVMRPLCLAESHIR